MRLLVGTHVLLWAVADPGQIPGTFRDRIEAPDNEPGTLLRPDPNGARIPPAPREVRR